MTRKLFSNTRLAAILAAFGVASAPAAYLALPQAAHAQQASQIDQVVAALRGITTMKANFTQADRNGQRVSGVLTLKRPGRIRFQYEEGVPLLIVSDGKAMTLVDYEVRQVERWPISDSPLGALLDPSRDVKRYGTMKPTGNPNVLSVEVKDSSKPEFGTITLVFVKKASAPGGLELVSWVALDSQNKRTTVRLANQRYGMSVPDRTFTYTDPRRSGRR
ncbi:outer membrane lipoprotein carrier protein LolA [Alteriqipengyuania flavescens]|uniref:LolA family protein n=1 Tax=Alteriqipengyuania flavescens TaxID=3053610 RepID=UPI0025B2F29C|nr:outer membrane lipoprotein carrier protein LolA [Alteriqipengyuania flavescens]WJY19379.1 outer membrane lipoprotein carrier protein LolA [Alteriqipengyuania flavescens]WJY25321.1 outer membrane lipoprotein carrier protein LolA [Alteriqipengyuania flavescens]